MGRARTLHPAPGLLRCIVPPPAAWSDGQQENRHRQRAAEEALAKRCRPFAGQPVPQRMLCKRILKCLPELFPFVADPRVPADKNAAERIIRPPHQSEQVL
jgi:hypothetical protein